MPWWLRHCVPVWHDPVVLAGGLDHPPAFADVVADRLLDVDVLARLAGPDRRPGRASGWAWRSRRRRCPCRRGPCGGPVTNFGSDAPPLDHLLLRLAEDVPVHVADGRDPGVLLLGEPPEVILAPPPEPDHGDAHRVIGAGLPRCRGVLGACILGSQGGEAGGHRGRVLEKLATNDLAHRDGLPHSEWSRPLIPPHENAVKTSSQASRHIVRSVDGRGDLEIGRERGTIPSACNRGDDDARCGDDRVDSAPSPASEACHVGPPV